MEVGLNSLVWSSCSTLYVEEFGEIDLSRFVLCETILFQVFLKRAGVVPSDVVFVCLELRSTFRLCQVVV